MRKRIRKAGLCARNFFIALTIFVGFSIAAPPAHAARHQHDNNEFGGQATTSNSGGPSSFGQQFQAIVQQLMQQLEQMVRNLEQQIEQLQAEHNHGGSSSSGAGSSSSGGTVAGSSSGGSSSSGSSSGGSSSSGSSSGARNPVNGACGSSNGQSLSNKPIANLCITGTASTVSGNGPWDWSCEGSNGGATALCAASPKATPVNGACGSSNGESVSSAPAGNLCTTGTASSVTGSGPWHWSCTGSNGGTSAQCAASLKVTAVNGACGSSNGESMSSKPTANLCTTGTASSVTGNGPWNWSCTGSNGGTSAQCVASLKVTPLNGVCGSSNDQSLSSKPTTNLCSIGTASAISGSGPWAWSCAGSNGGITAQCAASLKSALVNGACGSSNGESLTSKPTTGLCGIGTASSVSGSGPWAWDCAGSNGGTTAQCAASLKPALVNGVCGSVYGQTLSSEPTTNLCSSGTATAITVDGSAWIWQCTGSPGGDVAGCYAYNSGSVNSTPCSGQALPPTTPPPQAAAAGFSSLAFDDEFNSIDTISADGSGTTFKWYAFNVRGANLADGNYSVQNGCLTISNDPLTGGGGGLATVGSPNATTGIFQHAYFEASIQFDPTLANSSNDWPSFWSWAIEQDQGANPSGELDFMEAFPTGSSPPVEIATTIHQWNDGSSIAQSPNNTPTLPANFDYSTFHTYGTLWTPDQVSWYIDNQLVMSEITGPGTDFTALEQDHMYVILNTGLNWPMVVDWVRVWQ